MNDRRFKWSIAAILFVVVLVAYVETMAGSSSFWDCGEFIACAYSLGIPHPPATPLYVVLGRVFTLLPLPALSIAQKVNFASALFGALGIVVLFLIIVELIRERRGQPQVWVDRVVIYGSALVGALFTAWSNTYWGNAIEAEVYSISSFVMGLTTLLALRCSRNIEDAESTRSIYLIVYLLSLGVGFHLGTVLTYPAIALYLLLFRNKSFKNIDLVIFSAGFLLFLLHVNLKFSGSIAQLTLLLIVLAVIVRTLTGHRFSAVTSLLFVLGITIHLFLLIRSAQNPAIDEADPETLSNLLAVLRREQYPPARLDVRKASWTFQIVDHFWRYFTEQYAGISWSGAASSLRRLWAVPMALGICGVVSLAWKSRRSFVLLFGTFLITSLGMIIVLNFSDHEVRERDYFYSPAFYFFGVFIGLGCAAALDWFFGSSKKYSRIDRIGYATGIGIFLLLTGLLYRGYHFEHDRTHERVPWGYGYNMLAGLEENALIFTNGDNDTFPLWFQQEVEGFRKDVRVINLSLLNTTWYPKQLRDNEPRVELTWTDAKIDDSQGLVQDHYRKTGNILQPRDVAVRRIIRENFGKKPIYFAVTIPRESLQDYEQYLVLEGIVYRMQREKGEEMRDFEVMARNVDEVYRFDGILTADGKHDDSVYRDENQVTLIQNYAGSFIRLGQRAEDLARATQEEQARQAHRDDAIRRYEHALEIAPDFEQLTILLGNVYQEAGRDSDAARLFTRLVERDPDNDRYRFELGRAHLGAGNYDAGFGELRRVARNNPEDEFLWQFLISTLWEAGRVDETQRIVDEWEAAHAGDTRMRVFQNQVKQGLTSFSSPIKPSDAAAVDPVTPANDADIPTVAESAGTR